LNSFGAICSLAYNLPFPARAQQSTERRANGFLVVNNQDSKGRLGYSCHILSDDSRIEIASRMHGTISLVTHIIPAVTLAGSLRVPSYMMM
jgi:hypothetical protein